ncbi:NAD-dependent succinate-semialdehyde dehydrogenase [Acidiphilium acidophilum]|uniref:NAD-dependent succinate-semialdehyde dehydrogenase n=1 Tax=Acidiphilium acidophilum TaxID=76588 RepID=UPI002E8E68B1|nr:NAD-dependent succinate-semialdehyde dehydrogenase [Acidiphilium acidophilum]
MYKDVLLHIGGEWTNATSGRTIDVVNPATEDVIGTVAHAGREDLDVVIEAAEKGYAIWRATPAFKRAALLRKAADLIRDRAPEIATIMTMEQGKPFAESKGETLVAADILDWFSEEAKRTYGRVIPARGEGIYQLVLKEPVGIVAAFTPWNFPINQAVRKVAGAVAAGCAVILKGPEETPGSCAELVRAFADAGLPPGVLNLVYGVPQEISEYLIPHRAVRKISFTGSTAVGKHLAALAGQHMKRATMELGGHAPAIVFEDADLDAAAKILAANKFRNAGQVCVAPTRFLVHEGVYDGFMERFLGAVKKIIVGNGLEESTTMGPLANERRIPAIESFIADAKNHGARIAAGGERIGNKGYFFLPTVMTDVPITARVMNEEPFGPLALVNRFSTFEDAMKEANRLDYGLASYAYSRSNKTVTALGDRIESGMISINHHGIALPETPFGGMKDSGYGWEGGTEAIEAYLATKFVSQAS